MNSSDNQVDPSGQFHEMPQNQVADCVAQIVEGSSYGVLSPGARVANSSGIVTIGKSRPASVDPRDQSLHVLVLESAKYVDAGAGPVAVSRILPDFKVDVAELFRKASVL